MDREARILKQARLGLDLSPREMADLVGFEESHVEALETGAAEPSTDQLDRYARVFGLSLRRFLAGGADGAPPSVLFRSLHAEGQCFEDLLQTGASSVLGDFLRCTAEVAELETVLGEAENRMARELGGLTPEVAIFTRTSPACGSGVGSSFQLRASTPTGFSQSQACMGWSPVLSGQRMIGMACQGARRLCGPMSRE